MRQYGARSWRWHGPWRWRWPARGLLPGLLLAATAAAQDRDAVAGRVAAAPRSHPRLFVDAEGFAAVGRKVAGDPTLAAVLAHLRRCADAMLDAAPVQRQQVGRRLLGVSRTCLQRVATLAMVFRLTGDDRYRARAQREMLAAAGFRDWNPSHFLDVAEMTAALALGYDWLHAELAPAARATIRAAIVGKGLRTSLRGGWWVTTTNNWNQVCHAGLTLGALAVLEDEPELAARIVHRAVKNVPRAMAEYEPDGAYPEGPGYWVYGTSFNVLLIDALRTVLGTDFGLAQRQGFRRAATYYLHATGPTGLFFNYSDCGSRSGVAPAMYWFAAAAGDPGLLFRERHNLRVFLELTKPSAAGANRLLPFLLLWSPATGLAASPAAAQPRARHYRARGRTPIAVHRSGWQADATFVGVKGGSPGTNHAHMDVGAFVMDADGVRWAIDLGAQSYHSLESQGIRLWDAGQDSQRWTVFRLNSHSHNTLVVDGGQQRVTGSAPITRFVDDGPRPHTLVDLAPVYAGQLAAVRRGVALAADRSVVVQDELRALAKPAPTVVRWGMVTRAEVQLAGATAVLTQAGKRLTMRLLAPAGATFRTYQTARPPARHDHGNPGTAMVGFEVRVPPGQARTLAVWLAPAAGAEAPPVVALDDW